MTTWHDESILLLGETNETLLLWIVVFNCLFSVLCVILTRQSIDRLQLEWKAVDEDDLFVNVASINVLISISLEDHVTQHGVLLALVLVVDRDNHGVVVLDRLGQFKSSQVAHVESDHSFRDLLTLSLRDRHLLDV